jgi:hypothetical protein
MKKLLFGLMATMMLTISYAQTSVPKEDPPLIELEFGRKSRGCAGFGICKFKVTITVETAVTLITAFARSNGTLTMTMSKDVYLKNIKNFPNNYLQVDEDYIIDRETTKAIGIPDNYTIKTGKYQVVFDKATNTYNCTF